jgi:hypothetical protein
MVLHMDLPNKWPKAATTLLAEMSADLHGEFSPSIYETGRLARHAPSLRGHPQRVHFLLNEQQMNGEWGSGNEYGLLPTLSATEALLSTIGDLPAGNGSPIHRNELVGAAHRGLHALFGRLNAGAKAPLPDTVAVEILVPGLIAEINEHLAGEPLPGLDAWRDRRLAHHPSTNPRMLDSLREGVIRGHVLPTKLLHSLEVFGAAARGARFVEPVQGGVGCSPAPRLLVWHPEMIDWLFRSDGRMRHPGGRSLKPLFGESSPLWAEGQRHTAYRQVLGPPLRGRRLADRRGVIADTAHSAIDELRAGTVVELLAWTRAITLRVIARILLGRFDDALLAAVTEWIDKVYGARYRTLVYRYLMGGLPRSGAELDSLLVRTPPRRTQTCNRPRWQPTCWPATGRSARSAKYSCATRSSR